MIQVNEKMLDQITWAGKAMKELKPMFGNLKEEAELEFWSLGDRVEFHVKYDGFEVVNESYKEPTEDMVRDLVHTTLKELSRLEKKPSDRL